MDTNSTNTSNSAPLAENQYVNELFAILNDNGRDTAGLSALIGHVSEMEQFVKHAESTISDMKNQLSTMKEVQNHPVRTALQNTIKALEIKVAEFKERIGELKDNIIAGAKNAIKAFKEKGITILNKLASFFNIKGGLQAMDKSAAQGAEACEKTIQKIDNFANQYHAIGRAVKNMGRIITGKEPLDTKKEAGKLAKSVSAPYKAEKAVLTGMRKVIGAAIGKLSQLEKTAAKQTVREKKPSVLGELAENLERVEREKLEKAVQEHTKAKGTEL
ncbi:hypothetical protein FACS1894105_05610 [Clostridia bacterium]|nr:hypothetical protein FACS1894105_05610 [Clostridia bacterium]